MLNKGPHIVSAMRFLDDAFARMVRKPEQTDPDAETLSVSTAFGELHDVS
jgi:hypothetical protein